VRRVLLLLLGALTLALLAGTTPARAVPASTGWSWPLPGTPDVQRPFDPPTSPWGRGHRGVDLGGELHEPVLAAGSGMVTYAGLLAGRGVVTVTHRDGLRTTYEPVDALVTVGERVGAGDVIGTLGTGHASCRLGTVCLHWGLLRGETYLDPLTVVVSGHVRLLPLTSVARRDRKDRTRSRSRRSSDEEARDAPKKEGFAKRFGRAAGRVAKRTGRVAARVGRAAGRLGKAAGRVAGRAAVRLAAGVGRVGARVAVRAAPYALRAAPYAVDAVPYVAVAAVVVGVAVWYVRRR
jgi:hypothetical protein